MSDFSNNLTSISWWIGVVVVGILINVAAIYLKSPIDWLVSSISTKYQTRSKAKRAEREAEIENLVGNKHEQILHASKINFTSLVGVLFFLFGILFNFVASWLIILGLPNPIARGSLIFKIGLPFILIIGVYLVFQGVSNFAKAFFDQEILREAKDRESKVEPK